MYRGIQDALGAPARLCHRNSISFLLAGSGERAAGTLTSLAGDRRSPRGRGRRPIIRSNTHAPDQTGTRLRLLQSGVDLAAPDRATAFVFLFSVCATK